MNYFRGNPRPHFALPVGINEIEKQIKIVNLQSVWQL